MKARSTTTIQIDKFNIIKIKNFCETKDIIKKVKKKPPEWEKVSTSHISDKRQVSRIYKKILQCSNKKAINQPTLKNG